jgi:hypothetical protein
MEAERERERLQYIHYLRPLKAAIDEELSKREGHGVSPG